MVDYVSSVNPYLNVLPDLQNQADLRQPGSAKDVKREFMALFLKELLRNSFGAEGTGFDSLLEKEDDAFGAAPGYYNDALIQKITDELIDSGAFGFDELFPSYVKNYVKKEMPDGSK